MKTQPRCLPLPAFLLILSAPVDAGVFQKTSLERMVEQCDAIVIGQVFSKRSYWDERRRFIVTDNTILVSETLKGTPRLSLVVKSLGGEVGNLGMINTASETFTPGEKIVLFVVEGEEGKWLTLNMAQGKFRLIKDEQRQETYVQGALPGGTFSETRKQDVDGWKLESFINTVRALAAGSRK